MSRVNKKGPFGFDCLGLFCQHIMQDCQNKVRKELFKKKKQYNYTRLVIGTNHNMRQNHALTCYVKFIISIGWNITFKIGRITALPVIIHILNKAIFLQGKWKLMASDQAILKVFFARECLKFLLKYMLFEFVNFFLKYNI